jgi:hypothetical protein
MSTMTATAIGPYRIGERPSVLLSTNLAHFSYHFALGALGSGRGAPDGTLPDELLHLAGKLFLLRRPTTPTRNQWMAWEQTLREEDHWHGRMGNAIDSYRDEVLQTLQDTVTAIADTTWLTWRPLLQDVMVELSEAPLSKAVERMLPVLERVFDARLPDRTELAVLPRTAYRPPLAFNTPQAIDLLMVRPDTVTLVELLFHQLAHAATAHARLAGHPTLVKTLDDALKTVNVADPPLDVWHTIAHYGAADLARRTLGLPASMAPGHRDLAASRRAFLTQRARAAWADLLEERATHTELAATLADILLNTQP